MSIVRKTHTEGPRMCYIYLEKQKEMMMTLSWMTLFSPKNFKCIPFTPTDSKNQLLVKIWGLVSHSVAEKWTNLTQN